MQRSRLERAASALRGKTRLFARSREAGILPLVALCGMMLIGFVGFALDTGRQTMMQSQLQSAIDAAGLSAVARIHTSEIREEVERFALANFHGGFVEGEITQLQTRFSADGETVLINASVEAPSTFMQLFGVPRLQASAYTEITRAMGGLELALVLDVTGSMNFAATGGGTRLQALKQASKDLLDILYGNESEIDNLYVGIVPFSHTVNIGTAHNSWMASRNSNWRGCIQARAGYDLTDQPPTSALRFTPSYTSNCPPAITPMTTRKSQLVSAIDSLTAIGGTHTNYGAVWGWRMLSPRWRGYWGGTMTAPRLPMDYSAGNMSKAVVIMTDGKNEWGTSSAAYPGSCLRSELQRIDGTWYVVCMSADARPYFQPSGITPVQVNSELDDRLSEVCTRMKNAGIMVYTVAFDSPGADIEDRMRRCASNETLFFNSPSASELRTAFAKIGDSLAALRVSR